MLCVQVNIIEYIQKSFKNCLKVHHGRNSCRCLFLDEDKGFGGTLRASVSFYK